MKTAIAIDSLIKRDESTFLLELFLNLYPNSEIYTIAHKRGGVLGPVETRPIVSSFLSHKAKTNDSLKKNFWVLPSAVEAIPLHKSIEKIIVISHGFIHGLKIPDHVEKYLYLHSWKQFSPRELGWQRFFQHYVNNWREKSLSKYHKISVSSEYLQNLIGLPNAEILVPTFKTEDYPFVRDEDHNFLFTHHLILTHGMLPSEFKNIVTSLLENGEIVRVLGPDEGLKTLVSHPNIEFAGDHCEATTALYSHQAKVVWDFSSSSFPSKSFGAFCTGRPVVVRDNPQNREFLTDGAFFFKNDSELSPLMTKISEEYLSFDRRKLRRLGLKWNERLFKSRMSKFTNR